MTLSDFFKTQKKIALGFSGGVDSSYLLAAAIRAGANIYAYYVKTAFQPQSETDKAIRVAKSLGTSLAIISLDILSLRDVAANTPNRCYHCKKAIFTAIRTHAKKDGCELIIDGTNASDDISNRPGTVALNELEIYSPLREYGITKKAVRTLSREIGLKTHNLPSYTCLATRIPTNTPITNDLLTRVECGEKTLKTLGFTDFRIRIHGKDAKIELLQSQMHTAVDKCDEITKLLSPYFENILLNIIPRQNNE